MSAQDQASKLDDDTLGEIIWDYMLMRHELRPCDLIMALGSNDLRVAEHAAALYLRGLAPLLLFSGNVGKLTRGQFTTSEAETFADVAVARGVPRAAILIEPLSTNTGENIQFSRRLLEARGLDPKTFIVVQKPYMERRAYATFMRNWAGKEILMSSPPLTWREYPTPALTREIILPIMVGDLQRIRDYPARGFQVAQEIPPHVWAAYEELVRRGHTSHLIRD
jgi:uncharacterized SAM-binding protein YcdF (DUF218 family)